jgi:signal transduction histidine kinase
LRELEEARVRLQVAADTERAQAAGRLRRDLTTLRSCAATVAGTPEIARELAAAAADVERIVAGLPPEGLGHGGLGPALTRLCARHPVPVSLTYDERATADAATETALYYVCCEALANSAKHARASRVEVSLSGGSEVILTIIDNGVGGADPRGAGILGMQDRVAAAGGSLTVDSPPDTGTRVEARAPSRPGREVQSIRT